MIVQTIHEILNVFDVYVKHLGEGSVLMYIAGSPSSNPQYSVRLHETGYIRTVDQNDLIMYGNPSAGQPLVPPIPDSWLSDTDREKKAPFFRGIKLSDLPSNTILT